MKYLITSGCSFTAGEIPLPNNTKDDYNLKGSVWPHFCFAQSFDPEIDTLTNLAMPGGGNIAAMDNLIHWLEKYKDTVSPEDVLVVFNLTELNRWDSPCSVDNPKANKDLACIEPQGITHFSNKLGVSWITHGVRWPDRTLDNVDIISSLAIINCFSYLERHGFRYFFMFMNEKIYSDAPAIFQKAVDERKKHWIQFGCNIGMYEFALSNNQTTDDGHPTIDGHKLIASQILDKINGST